MELSEEIKGMDHETVSHELFNIIVKDKEWVTNILRNYSVEMGERILGIKEIVGLYKQIHQPNNETKEDA